MLKAFFIYGLSSGRRFSTAARGYDIRKDDMSLTAIAGQRMLCVRNLGEHLHSSVDAPSLPAAYSNAVKTLDHSNLFPAGVSYEY